MPHDSLAESQKLMDVSTNLESARQGLVAVVAECVDSGDYDSAKAAMDIAQRVDDIAKAVKSLLDTTSGERAGLPPTTGRLSSFPTEAKDLPFYYADGDRLVMRGPSRDGTYYDQKVPRAHYDLIVAKLCTFRQKSEMVRNQALIDRAEMPVHEPSLILKLLAAEKLLVPLQKGLYVFADVEDFEKAARRVWDNLPRVGAIR